MLFALNVAIGISNGNSPETLPSPGDLAYLFRPWLWDWSATTTLQAQNHSMMKLRIGTFTDPLNVSWQDVESIFIPGSDKIFFGALTSELNKDFETLRSTDATLTGEAFQWATHPTLDNKQKSLRSWPAVLGQISQYPYPLPHKLKLTYFFELPNVALGSSVVAVPFIDFNNVVGQYSPADELSPASTGSGRYTIRYHGDQLAGVTSVATVAARNNASQLDENILDPNRSWIAIRDLHVGSGWQNELEDRFADAFDIGQRLIDGLRLTLSSSRLTKDEISVFSQNVPLFRRLVLAALFDTADFGLSQGPEGVSLAVRIFRNTAADEKQIETALKSGEAKIHDDSTLAQLRSTWMQFPILASSYAISRPLALRSPSTDPAQMLGSELADLETLQSALSEDSTLRALLLSYWDKALSDAKYSDWGAIKSTIASSLKNESIRRAMLAANLRVNGHLNKITALTNSKQSDERAILRASFKTELLQTITTALQPLQAEAGAAHTSILASLSTWIDNYTVQVIPDAHLPSSNGKSLKNDVLKPKRQTVVDGITLQVDGLSARKASGEDQQDLARDSSGICVLMRRAKEAPQAKNKENTQSSQEEPWRWLNAARIRVRNSDVEFKTPVLVPMPFTNQGELRQAFVSYNNEPLSAHSPAAEFAQRLYVRDANDEYPKPLLEYSNPYGMSDGRVPPDPSNLKLPALVFGTSYEVLAFRVRNSGALPPALVTGQNPGEFIRTPTINSSQTGKVRYVRTAPIGDLRPVLWNPTAQQAAASWPGIPDRVSPRSRDSVEIARFESLLRSDGLETDSLRQAPLVILNRPVEEQRERRFLLYRPTTDLHTWDRWVNGDPSLTKLRQKVWAEYNKRAVENRLDRDDADAKKIMLEDPAVGSAVNVSLYIFDASQGNRKQTAQLDWPPASLSNDKDIDTILSSPLTLTVKTIADLDAPVAALTASGTSIVVTLPKGQVAQLVVSVAQAPGTSGRFDSTLEDNQRTAYFKLIVETTTEELPTRDQLSASFEHSIAGSIITARLQGASDKSDTSNLFRYVGRAEYLRQFWIWEGRAPKTPFPFSNFERTGQFKNTDHQATLESWELEQFITRTEGDYSITPMLPTVRSVPTRAAPNPLQVVNVRIFQHLEDLSKDPRAMYIRTGLRVFSRYEGINASTPVVVPIATTEFRHRLFVPCRSSLPVPTPHIKIILPLTEPAPTSPLENASGLLVVVEGPWYQIGGVAEGLKAELLVVKDEADKEWTEAGPDPILVPPVGINTDSVTLSGLIGPIGHTFDDTDQTPLLTTTSFILPAPNVQSTGAQAHASDQNPSWYFAKVRFKRTLQFEKPEESLPTDPYWVQFLPRFDFGDDGLARAITPQCTGGIIRRLTLQPPLGQVPYRFQWLMVITNLVPDVGGRRDQFSFLGFMVPDVAVADGSSWVPAPGNTLYCTDDERVRAHLFELQTTPKFSGPLPTTFRELLSSLFPDGDREPTMRIARISAPMAKTMRACVATAGVPKQ